MADVDDVWSRCLVCFDPPGAGLAAVIAALAEAAVGAGVLPVAGRDEAVQAVMRRELSGSTVMEGGIAFPHGRTAVVSEQSLVLGVFRHGKGFLDETSGLKVWLVALMFVPLSAPGTGHIQMLAALCRRVMCEEVVARLRGATCENEVRNTLREKREVQL